MNALILSRSDGMWLNEPEQWTAKGDSLQVIISKATDFWRETHYGFNRDSRHFLGFPTAEAFTAELPIQATIRRSTTKQDSWYASTRTIGSRPGSNSRMVAPCLAAF